MSHETIINIGWVVLSISVGLMVLWGVVVFILVIREDDPPPGNVFLWILGACFLWPITLTGVVLYSWGIILLKIYRKRKWPIRKIRARYWEYRAKREEDIAPKRTSRKVSELP